jgi:hypothetical protein
MFFGNFLRWGVRVTKGSSNVSVFQYRVMKEYGETVLDREKRHGRFIPGEMCHLIRSVGRSRAQLRDLEEMKSQPMLVIEPRFLSLHLVTILTDNLLQLMDGCASSSVSLRIDVTKISLWS